MRNTMQLGEQEALQPDLQQRQPAGTGGDPLVE